MNIVLIENFGSDFYNARLRYAKFLINMGHSVTAIIPDDGYIDKVKDAGVCVLPINIDIRKRSVLNIIKYFNQIRIYTKSREFDIIHFYRMQPNIIGTIASGISGNKQIVNHITGLGVAFSSNEFKYLILRKFIVFFYRINHFLFNTKIIVQNIEDKIDLNINTNNIIVIKGSAVDESKFNQATLAITSSKEKLNLNYLAVDSKKLLFVSRLLKQKGLSELIKAIKEINVDKIIVELFVVGWIDKNNPDSFTENEILEFINVKGVHILGKRDDVNDLIAIADICILPTYYREGTPRFLLESMAMGKPIITTDTPGCNHLIQNNLNGILVKPKSVDEIKLAIYKLLSIDLTILGSKSKDIYLENFSEEIVYNSIYQFYLKK
jgi:glycosyltransferase involved in cell wall biosynthesis